MLRSQKEARLLVGSSSVVGNFLALGHVWAVFDHPVT